MSNRSQAFDEVPRETAVAQFSRFYNKLLKDHYDGDHTQFAKDTYGVNDKGVVQSASQCRKWRFAEDNSLPGTALMELFLDQASKLYGKPINSSDTINHNIKIDEPPRPTYAKRGTGAKALAKKANGAGPAFKMGDVDLPEPEMHFDSAKDLPGYFDFQLRATLPLAGVLAIMAMLDDAG